MNLVYQLGQNLFIRGNKVISYETHVATIKDNILYEFGKFSHTTSKHLHKVADLLKLKREKKDKKVYFRRFEEGVKVNVPNSLSPKTSIHFLINGVRTKEQIWNYITENRDSIPSGDWGIFREILDLDLNTPHPKFQKVNWINIQHSK